MYLCGCTRAMVSTRRSCTWRALYCEFSGGQTRVVRPGRSGLCPLSHLASPLVYFLILCVHTCEHTRGYVGLEKGTAYPAARIMGSCEVPDTRDGKGVPVRCKDNLLSYH